MHEDVADGPDGSQLPLSEEHVQAMQSAYACLKSEATPLLLEYFRLKGQLVGIAGPLNDLGERAKAVLRALGLTERMAEQRVREWRQSAGL